jgi:hypothetical protein
MAGDLGTRLFESTMQVLRICEEIVRTGNYDINVLLALRQTLNALYVNITEYDEHDGEEELSVRVHQIYIITNFYEEEYFAPLLECLDKCHRQNGLVDGIEHLVLRVAILQWAMMVLFNRIPNLRNE